MASAAGQRVDPELLAAAAALDEVTLYDALRECVSRQVLVPDPTAGVERYVFRHALLQEAIYDDLLPGERTRLHAAFARTLEARAAGDGAHAAELAYHWYAAHDLPRALEIGGRGGGARRLGLCVPRGARPVRTSDRPVGPGSRRRGPCRARPDRPPGRGGKRGPLPRAGAGRGPHPDRDRARGCRRRPDPRRVAQRAARPLRLDRRPGRLGERGVPQGDGPDPGRSAVRGPREGRRRAGPDPDARRTLLGVTAAGRGGVGPRSRGRGPRHRGPCAQHARCRPRHLRRHRRVPRRPRCRAGHRGGGRHRRRHRPGVRQSGMDARFGGPARGGRRRGGRRGS